MAPLNAGYQQLVDEALARYPGAPRMTLEVTALRLQTACNDIQALVRQNILDIGCGSPKSLDHPSLIQRIATRFRPIHHCLPWYCRLAALAKDLHDGDGEITGIDLGDNKDEPFNGIKRDLTDPHTLGSISDESFDVVNNNLFTFPEQSQIGILGFSPALRRHLLSRRETLLDRLQFVLHGSSHAMRNSEGHDTLRQFSQQIHAQVTRLLRTGGTYTFGPLVYRKSNAGLIPENAESTSA